MKSPPFILCEPPLSGIPPFYPTQTRGVRSCSACSHAYREAPVRWTGASFLPVLRRHTGRTESSAPTAFLRREALSLRGAQRRGNPFSARRRRADGTSGTPSPTMRCRGECSFCGGTHGSRPTGCGGNTGRTESSAPTMQDKNRAGRDVGDAVPYDALPGECSFCGGTHGSRPTGCGRNTGRTESSAPLFSSACPRSGRTAPGYGGAARRAPAPSAADRRPSGSGRRPAPRQEAAYRS